MSELDLITFIHAAYETAESAAAGTKKTPVEWHTNCACCGGPITQAPVMAAALPNVFRRVESPSEWTSRKEYERFFVCSTDCHAKLLIKHHIATDEGAKSLLAFLALTRVNMNQPKKKAA